MKTLLLSTLFVLAALALAAQDDKSKRPSPPASTAAGNVELAYCQPSKKGRAIFGSLVPYGKVWRTGANEATTITFKQDGTFGGKAVKAGTYALFTIPGETEWTVILNSVANQWGAYSYDESKDVLRVTVKPQAYAPTEVFQIKADGEKIWIMWDETAIAVPYE